MADKSILIIDDEANLRRSLDLILKHAGYLVSTAGNEEEAWQCLKTASFDLVLLDIKMPDASGLDLLAPIIAMHPGMPVAILTAHTSVKTAIEAIEKGACSYLLKPINPPQIMAKVKELLLAKDLAEHRKALLAELQSLAGRQDNWDMGGLD